MSLLIRRYTEEYIYTLLRTDMSTQTFTTQYPQCTEVEKIFSRLT